MRQLITALLFFLVGIEPSPVGAQIAVLGNTVVEHQAAPGDTYTGSIVVRNLTARHQPVRIYQTDYHFDADGRSRFDAAGTQPRSNARWIALNQRSVTLAPQSELSISYFVTVPRDSLRGSYWSSIMVEGAPSNAVLSPHERSHVGIGSVVRYAIQVATHVSTDGGGRRQLAFDAPTVVAEPGDTAFQVDVRNTGDRAYRPAIWVEVYDDSGALRHRMRQQRGLLYPGTSLRQRFALTGLHRGAYRAVVFVDAGADAVFAAPFALRF